MIWLGVIAVAAAALAGAPLVAVLMGAAMLGFLSADIDLAIVAIEVYRIVDTPLLVALPLFTYAGYVLSESKTSERLVAVAQSLFGWMPSGLAVVGFGVCAVFTALTGASGVTIVALGALLLPALRKAGFGERFSLGLVTTSGSLGLLLVPSVPLILYGIIVQQLGIGEPFTHRRTVHGGHPAVAVDAGLPGRLDALAASRRPRAEDGIYRVRGPPRPGGGTLGVAVAGSGAGGYLFRVTSRSRRLPRSRPCTSPLPR